MWPDGTLAATPRRWTATTTSTFLRALVGDRAAGDRGWFDYVAVVHPVDQPAREQMLRQGHGNPFIHHITWGIAPPDMSGADAPLERAGRIISFMAGVRTRIPGLLASEPGTLIMPFPGRSPKTRSWKAGYPGWLPVI